MSLVSIGTSDRIAMISIDNPPVSTGNAALRAELYDAFTGLELRDDIDAVVLCSAQPHFYTGSDLREFDGDIAFPSSPQIIEVISRIKVPVVAALNGMALGAGLEIALACDARVAADDALLGLPEVTLGIFPGAGGTVRLPRLIGVPRAIDMIASGKPVTAKQAYDFGLVDEVADPTRLVAISMKVASTAKKRRAHTLPIPYSSEAARGDAMERGSRGGAARPNVLQAIALIVSGSEIEGSAALEQERAAFDEIRVSEEARNLRYLFFAKRSAAKDLAVAGRPRAVQQVGVAGAGTMGSRICASFLAAGIDVVLYEVSQDVRASVTAALAEHGAEKDRWGSLGSTDRLDELSDCELVIDAVFEDMDVKRELLVGLDHLLRADAVIASNTSYLDLNELSSHVGRPERFLGLHFFNPADRNRLLEVVKTESTGAEALAVAAGVARSLRKTPILAGVGDGFVANRVYADYRTQAEFLVEDGASPRQVDDAMRALGLPIGPFAVADMSGLDIAWARRKRLGGDRDPQQRYVTIADTLCERGRLGKKSGAGWYRYDDAHPRGADDEVVDEIIREARDAKGIAPRTLDEGEIQQRIICSMLVAAASVVESGVAQRASDIDVAFTEGFAFPTWLGGPLRYAAAQPADWTLEGLANVHASDPVGFSRAASAAEGDLPGSIRTILAAVS